MNRIKVEIVKLFALITLMLQPNQTTADLKNYLQEDFNFGENRKPVLRTLFKQIEDEGMFLTCAVFGKPLPALAVEMILHKDMQKVLVVHEDLQSVTKYCGDLKNFLVVVRWHEQTSLELFNDLAHVMAFRRRNKILVIRNAAERTVNRTDIEYFFNLSKLFKFPNLVLIFKDFHKTFSLYQFQIFPNFTVKKRSFGRENFVIFPNKIKNLQGAPLKTMPDQILPKTAAFRNPDGHVQVEGYVMKFLLLFSNYLNATLHFPLNITIGKPLEPRDIFNLTQRNVVDIPAALLSCQSPRCLQLMSDAYEVHRLCLMVPLEQPYSYRSYLRRNISNTYFWFYVAGRALLSVLLVLSTKVWSLKYKRRYRLRVEDILVNVPVVSGMLAGSFKLLRDPLKSMRFIYISLFLFGLINSIIYNIRLQTFLTHPFSHRIRSLPDLVPHNLRALVTEYEYHNLLRYYEMPPEKVALIFKTVASSENFFQILSSFNTSFAYPISSSLWLMFDALQNYRNKPLFRLTDICLPYSNSMAFMLPANSWFMESLNQLIGRVRDMGLFQHWLKTSYIDLIRIKKIYIPKDRVVAKKSSMLGFKDFEGLWKYMLRSYLCSLIAFVGELLCKRLCGRRMF